jgi:hypothetical protein
VKDANYGANFRSLSILMSIVSVESLQVMGDVLLSLLSLRAIGAVELNHDHVTRMLSDEILDLYLITIN